MRTKLLCTFLALISCVGTAPLVTDVQAENSVLPPVNERFQDASIDEVPSFQKHVVPLFGRLGCNGRACHGSFQGQGGFQLSLFGYDFQADHAALLDAESTRVDREDPKESLILAKPTDEDMHEGGERYAKDSWQYHVLHKWIEAGAEFEQANVKPLAELVVTPSEVVLAAAGEEVQLRAVAVWEDGTRKDVTPLCRFQSNDTEIALVTENGKVTAKETGDTHVVAFYDKAVVPVPVLRPVSELTGNKYPEILAPTRVDQLTLQKLQKLGIVPSELCGDAEFLRRVSLDLTGTLPTPQKVAAFLNSDDPDKRAHMVDELLETPSYTAWWTTKLCDFTGNNDEQLRNTLPTQTGSQDWYDWILRRVADNVPYDQLVAGIVTATSRSADQGYREYCEMMSCMYQEDAETRFADLPSLPIYWARRDFREPEARAIGFAYAFMGVRIQCAQCHKHPFDQWSKEDFHLFKNFFSGVATANNGLGNDAKQDYKQMVSELGLDGKRGGQLRRELANLARKGKVVPFPEIYVGGPRKSREFPDMPITEARLLGGESLTLKDLEDPRAVVMDWLRDENNRFFAPAFVNRVWASYFNVGIVNPPDDHSLANPPSNKALLDYLAKGFIASGFDMKWVHRTIANSHTYQLSWVPNETNKLDEKNFSRAIPRRLPAEVVYDAVQQATATDEQIAKMQQDLDSRAITVPGSSSRNRSNSDTAFALAVFGRSTRESNCDCDRTEEPSLLQTIFLQNDTSVLKKLESGQRSWIGQLARAWKPPAKSDDKRAASRMAGLEKQTKSLAARLVKLRKTGSEKAIQGQERRLAQLRKQLRELRPAESTPPGEVAQDEIDDVIQQAYLRTVSRYPTDDEMTRSREYFAGAKEPLDGARGLLWALLNTKEFIVNH